MKMALFSLTFILYFVPFNTDEEALDVIQIAHKYLLNKVAEQCEKILYQWIPTCVSWYDKAKGDDKLLRIITVANRIQRQDLSTTAIEALAKHNPANYCNYNKHFAALPIEVRYAIIIARLRLVDDKKDRH